MVQNYPQCLFIQLVQLISAARASVMPHIIAALKHWLHEDIVQQMTNR